MQYQKIKNIPLIIVGRGVHIAARRRGPSGKNVASRGRHAGHCCGGGVPLLDTDQARPGPSGNNVASGGRRAGHRQGGGVLLLVLVPYIVYCCDALVTHLHSFYHRNSRQAGV